MVAKYPLLHDPPGAFGPLLLGGGESRTKARRRSPPRGLPFGAGFGAGVVWKHRLVQAPRPGATVVFLTSLVLAQGGGGT